MDEPSNFDRNGGGTLLEVRREKHKGFLGFESFQNVRHKEQQQRLPYLQKSFTTNINFVPTESLPHGWFSYVKLAPCISVCQ